MTHKPEEDQWYEHNGTVARVFKVRADGMQCDMSNDERWGIGDPDCGHEFTQVRVVPMKPKRTLTVSQGLAWMRRFNLADQSMHLILSPQVVLDEDAADAFAVIDLNDSDGHGLAWYGPTPCAAIINARRSLKQVGK